MIPKAFVRIGKLFVVAILACYLALIFVTKVENVAPRHHVTRDNFDVQKWLKSLENETLRHELIEDKKNSWSLGRIFVHNDQKLLLPMFNLILGGPSYHHMSFIATVVYAIYHRRAIVMIPFPNFYYKITGEERFWWNFNETFDVPTLQKIVPMITPEEFAKQCRGRVKYVLSEPQLVRQGNYQKDYELAREQWERKLDITIPDLPRAPTSPQEIIEHYDAADNERCVCMYKPKEFVNLFTDKIASRETYDNITHVVSKHIKVASYITDIANEVIDYIRDYGPFLAIQWTTADRPMESVITVIDKIMKRHNLTCAYIGHPEHLTESADIALRRLAHRVFTYRNAVAMVGLTDSVFAKERYLWSLIEQEISISKFSRTQDYNLIPQ
ncbi:uncharacterized protein LOC144344621 [Saccoglossus kowalevskii]